MEPYYRDGDIVYVVPDREAIGAGKMVLVWLSDNGRVVKHLIHEDEDGAHLLQQSNPKNRFFAPVGSTVLGAVVGKRQIGAPKLSTKEIFEAIAEHMPHLLEDEPI
jgi:phage repressor protein C with HTH and peptisase S24 domain